jgi:glycyl-tRNA synthetase beta chain
MSATQDLLFEIGTEELPPKSLRQLRDSLHATLTTLLQENHLGHAGSHAYATPRRLAVLVKDLDPAQPDREVVRRGPAISAAFDAGGKPTRPAQGFARSCGVSVTELDRMETDKGSWLVWRSIENGRPAAEILPDLIERALKALPVPKRMRWGSSSIEFVRPVHWVLLLLGDEPVAAEILGLRCDRYTYGHRFHHNEKIAIGSAADYSSILAHTGQVMADMDLRRESIRKQVSEAGAALGGNARIDPGLLDEVTALVEWPVAITGGFDRRFLEVPAEALISSMQDHQKFFPVMHADGSLMPNFITIANILSKDLEQVRAGNERVIRPRLEDAAFFWAQDRKQTLASRIPQLDDMTFQQQLGSLGDKQQRVATVASALATLLGMDHHRVQRAAALSKCDLLTSMVFEFPDLQGIMGRYYALHDGEDPEVASALNEQYQPRFAGDSLPSTSTGQILAIAERLDTLAGIFAIGQTPTGDKDPFGLRRAALGLLRILIERHIDLDLQDMIETTAASYPPNLGVGKVHSELLTFIMDRLRAYYLEAGFDVQTFDAVMARHPTRPLDFDQRMRAVHAFHELPEADSLAAANKRIRNILRKARESGIRFPDQCNRELLQEQAEQELAVALEALKASVDPLFARREYTHALQQLSALQTPVDNFFDNVMVMSDDSAQRNNRLALLNGLSELFLQVADISQLQQG